MFFAISLSIGLIDRGGRRVWEISLAYILIERANSSALLPRPSSLTAFRFVQIDHRVMTISIATSSLSANMIETASIADICSAKLRRLPSKASKFHTCLASLHLKKRWPPSSLSLAQTGHFVSISMPRRARLQRSG